MPIFATDPGLLARFRAGERDALDRVYRAYVTEVFRALRHGFLAGEGRVSGMSEAAALEATQEVFVKAFAPTARQAYDGVRPYRPLLLRIAKNVRIDQLRRAAHAPAAPTAVATDFDALASSEDPGVPETAEPEALLHDERLRRATESYLATLTTDERRFVELRFVDELSQAEVADALRLTRRQVRTLEQQVQVGLRRHCSAPGCAEPSNRKPVRPGSKKDNAAKVRGLPDL